MKPPFLLSRAQIRSWLATAPGTAASQPPKVGAQEVALPFARCSSIVQKLICPLLGLGALCSSAFAQYHSWNGSTLLLDNGFIKRQVTYDRESHRFTTDHLLLNGSDHDFVASASPDFSCLVDGTRVDGYSGWTLLSCEAARDDDQGTGATVRLGNGRRLEIAITYLMYPQLPLIRKSVTLTNRGSADCRIEALDIEDLRTSFSRTDTVIHHNYGRMKRLGSYVGDWDDALVILHDAVARAGMALGNETPGVLKRVSYGAAGSNSVQVGTTHPGQGHPFRKWLRPGESWRSPPTFVALYADSDSGTAVMNGVVDRYVRKHMGIRLSRISKKPVFVYNTWSPFRTFVNDALVRDVAKAAAECGVQEFVIDDGWNVNAGARTSGMSWGENYGDWQVDREKFPDGLGPTFDYIRSLGMKPGLWLSIGSATGDAKVFREHPEWLVKNAGGAPGNLHGPGPDGSPRFYSSCFGTPWFDHIKQVLLSLVREHGLAYAKLDFAVVTSAYVDDPALSGCYATDHDGHRDREESFIVIYERVLRLFDELHEAAPELFIDCTFETVGKLQAIDYAFCKHADGNWLANFEQPAPPGALRVRQMAWWRSPAMPASALVIGNQRMDGPDFIYVLKSLLGTLPIVLGDPRELSPAQRAGIRAWSEWMRSIQGKYDYMSFRQDLPGFGEPQDGAWDGWQRLNTESKDGGIVGVFRHGAPETSRTVVLSGLDPATGYVVREAPHSSEVLRAKGEELMTTGFRVTIVGRHDGSVYEIGRLPP